jgi:hypothetical protein
VDEKLLQRIRELEGEMPERSLPETTERCPFAERVSFMSDKLYSCRYKKRCDNQIRYGTSDSYCKKYLNE